MKTFSLVEHKRLIVILLLAMVVAGVLWYVAFYIVLFRVVSISPDPSNFPTSSTSVTLTFTKKLDGNKTPTVTSKDALLGSSAVKDNTLTIQLVSQLGTNQRVVITVKDARAITGETLSQEVVLVGKYVDYANLSPQEQQKQVQQSDSFSSYSIISSLPITTGSYEINYLYPNSGETKMPIYITVKNPYPTPEASSSSTDSALYNAFLKKAQEEAYAALIALPGYEEKYYQIYYSEPMLGQGIKGSYKETMVEY